MAGPGLVRGTGLRSPGIRNGRLGHGEKAAMDRGAGNRVSLITTAGGQSPVRASITTEH